MQPENTSLLSRLSSLLPIGTFLLIAIGLLAGDAVNGSTVQDIDDIARRLQIADLLRDGEWHDLTWPFLAMPEPYVSPWSRLVDLPYVLVTWLFQPALGQDAAFEIARFVVPLLWLIAYAWLAVRLIREILGEQPSLPQIGAAAVASLFAVIEFMPNRVDHHNVQIVLLLALCLGIVSKHRFAGILVGVASVLSIAVGLECAPYIALALAGVAIHAALAPNSTMVARLSLTGWSLLAFTLPAGLLLTGGTLFQTQCDALSAPWASALIAAGVVAAGAPIIWKRLGLHSPTARLGVLVAGALVVLGVLWTAFPECHAGPYTMINETAHTYWISNVIQEKGPAGAFARGENLLVLIFMVLLALTLGAWMNPKTYRSPVLILLLIATLGTLLTAWQMRNFKFPAVLLPLFLPLFIERVREDGGARKAIAVLLPPVLLLASFALLVKPTGRALTLIDYMEGDACRDADLSSLETLPASRIMAPLGLSLTLAEYISDTGSAHKIAAMPFHRASPGIERVFQTFALTNPELRKQALAPYNYVAICTLPETSADPSTALLYATLSSSHDWPGLVEVSPKTGSRLRLFEIDHDTVE
ncbi:hypothetical protein [Hyphomonas sp. UBA4494]|uniref:hypothetical protein n=1 Tax=Hyphomonas sp. UBA4494 TaxID=1946631 RepID=UPI0025BA290E|nr:hypothetical protein [Hyphomonas sp. UBA4494]